MFVLTILEPGSCCLWTGFDLIKKKFDFYVKENDNRIHYSFSSFDEHDVTRI